MRARLPDKSGYVVNGGVRVYYEVFGTGPTTVLLMPTTPIVPAAFWKAQVPYLARHFRVVTFDPRGNGRSDRPHAVGAYAEDAYITDALAVLDTVGCASAFVVGLCTGVWWSALLATRAPDRVCGLVAIAPGVPLGPAHPHKQEAAATFNQERESAEGWAMQNRHYWLRDWHGYIEFHSAAMAPEPHSSKVVDDMVEWGLSTDAQTILRLYEAPGLVETEEEVRTICAALRCPVLVIHGDADACQPVGRAERLAELTGARLVVVPGGGHVVNARHPVLVNTLIRDFVSGLAGAHGPTKRHRGRGRTPRALWISSPIGLGHVQRDLTIARAVRERVPGLEIHWWAQPPVTEVLAEAGEIIHPASAEMSSESAHWESEAANHDLPAFYAFRRMDEIFCANYMLFDDVVRDTPYDLWVGDESWEVDYFLHENPERKIAPYIFMTDVIGFLPTDPDTDPREAGLCADYNADWIEKRERFPGLRDLSMFIGSFDELPDTAFGPGLPGIRKWSRRWFCSVPYVVPFNPAAYRDRSALRRRLGYHQDHPLLVAAVGGTAVGASLLELTCNAFSRLRKDMPDVRMVLVTGPRIDPGLLPDLEGVDKRGYVPSLFEHLACADAAVVQGGLSTTMELVATGRPFIYFPLRRHWEQQHFVAHRLDHYRAGIRMDYATTSADDLAAAMRTALAQGGASPGYRRVPRGGEHQAAKRIAALLAHSGEYQPCHSSTVR